MGKKLYGVLCAMGRRNAGGGVCVSSWVIFLDAYSPEEAEGTVYRWVFEKHPSSMGYENHKCKAYEVPQELIDTYATLNQPSQSGKPETTWAVSREAEKSVADAPKEYTN